MGVGFVRRSSCLRCACRRADADHKGSVAGPQAYWGLGLDRKKFFEFLKSRSLLHDDAVISFASLSERRHREGQQLQQPQQANRNLLGDSVRPHISGQVREKERRRLSFVYVELIASDWFRRPPRSSFSSPERWRGGLGATLPNISGRDV